MLFNQLSGFQIASSGLFLQIFKVKHERRFPLSKDLSSSLSLNHCFPIAFFVLSSSLCFRFNLSRAARKAAELGIDEFTTTLTVSRFKKSSTIFEEGDKLPGFVEFDFKKKDGFNRSIILSKELGLYRQQWCGCEFSKGERDAEKAL